MKYLYRLFTVIFFTIIMWTSSIASDIPEILDIDRCITIALSHNYDLKIQQDNIDEVRSRSQKTIKSQFPQITLGANYLRMSEVMEADIASRLTGLPVTLPPLILRFGDEDNYTIRASLSQPLFTGYRLRNSIKSSIEQINAEKYTLNAEVNNLVFSVREAFYNLLNARQTSELIQLSLKSIDEHLRDIVNLYDQGMITRNELLKVEIKKSEIELNIVRADNGIELARHHLRDILGIPLDSEFTITHDLSPLKIAVEDAEAIEMALEGRPEINTLTHKMEAMNHLIDAQRGDYFPSISLIGSYEYGKPGLNKLQNEWMDYWSVGLNANWKLWDWGIRKANVQGAKASLNRIRHTLNKLNHLISFDVQQSDLRVKELSDQLNIYRKKREQAEESFRLVGDEFKQGLATNTEFLDAENEMTKSRIEEYKSIIDYNIAISNYERAIGIYSTMFNQE